MTWPNSIGEAIVYRSCVLVRVRSRTRLITVLSPELTSPGEKELPLPQPAESIHQLVKISPLRAQACTPTIDAQTRPNKTLDWMILFFKLVISFVRVAGGMQAGSISEMYSCAMG